MESLYKIYHNQLLEGSTERCFTMFGNELFGDELGGNEKNTSTEDKYVDAIVDFTDNMYGEEITSDFIKQINNLKNCMSKYPEVLMPEKTTVYRGTMIPLKYFASTGKVIDFDKGNLYEYKAYSKIQSWTTNHSIANEFSSNLHLNRYASEIYLGEFNTPERRLELLNDLLKDNTNISFNLHHNVNKDDFLFKSKYLNRLSYNGDEDETLRINNKSIIVRAFVKIGGTQGLNKKGHKLFQLLNMAILGQ